MSEEHRGARESSPMRIGARLREIRRSQGVTLQKVAEAAGLSKSFVSQVENDATNPSISSLKKIGDALEIRLADLFDDADSRSNNGQDGSATPESAPPKPVAVVRKDRRKTLVWPDGNRSSLLAPDLQRRLEVIMNHMEPGSHSGDDHYTHDGEEFGVVLSGSLEVTVDGVTHFLNEGDSIYFDSRLPHRMRNPGDEVTTTLFVITPPTF